MVFTPFFASLILFRNLGQSRSRLLRSLSDAALLFPTNNKVLFYMSSLCISLINLRRIIKEESIAFARNKRRQLCRDEVLLTNRLIRLRQHLLDGDISVANSMCDVESRLKALHEKRIQGIIVRSRAEWIEEGECPSRYFFKLQTIKSQNVTSLRFMIQMGSKR